MNESSISFKINKILKTSSFVIEDIVAVEEPLEIGIYYYEGNDLVFKKVSITMRTPSDDKALALGFLFTENIIQAYHQVEKVETPIHNTIHVFMKKGVVIKVDSLDRNFYTTSSCGVCGKASIDAIRTIESRANSKDDVAIPLEIIYQLKHKLIEKQSLFETTGGLHASALYDLNGNLLYLKEDVGRHNALDKLIGQGLLDTMLPLDHHVLLLSGRASFELIQKAAAVHIKVICALGAPSSLAISLAKEFDITLIGFLKNESLNVYCGEKRILIND